VVPCYNEEEVLPELERRLTAACIDNVGGDYEIILVNDGSSDASWSILTRLAAADSHILAVDLAHNHGHQLALTAGLSMCAGERVLIMDGGNGRAHGAAGRETGNTPLPTIHAEKASSSMLAL